MRRITRDKVPPFWADYVRRNPRISYAMLEETDEGKELRIAIRNHLVRQQQYLCAYCCKAITEETAHNEHICPQAANEKLSMQYENLLASCKTQGIKASCGMKKGNDFDPSYFVSPLDEDCEQHFRFLDDGTIEGTTEKGSYTVALLNLNGYALKTARGALLKELDLMNNFCGKEYLINYYIKPNCGHLPRFVDMTSYFLRQGRFDENGEHSDIP